MVLPSVVKCQYVTEQMYCAHLTRTEVSYWHASPTGPVWTRWKKAYWIEWGVQSLYVCVWSCTFMWALCVCHDWLESRNKLIWAFKTCERRADRRGLCLPGLMAGQSSDTHIRTVERTVGISKPVAHAANTGFFFSSLVIAVDKHHTYKRQKWSRDRNTTRSLKRGTQTQHAFYGRHCSCVK